MSDVPPAVFLSYAREDTDAARRIAEALRSHGVEVWFDQSELRGGDAWDAKIKQQIRKCALFLAVVSAHTQERSEGYFRREWKFAVERTQDMAAGVAFVVPVVIDGTLESQALVPEEFLRVHWTRLPGALPTPEFVAQVKRVLGGKAAPVSDRRVGSGRTTDAGQRPAPPRAGIPGWIWAVVAVVLMAVVVGVVTQRKPEPAVTAPKTAAGAKPAGTLPASSEKSIAVLPFVNMSDDKENAFFADGVHEDILTNLANLAGLKVIARTSVLEYRGTTKKIGQIARELGVAYVLEGSVRRAGGKVRVVCQLIDARTEAHVWAPPPYDRDLVDIFALQSELAKNIAAKLQIALSPGERATLERVPTANLTAYDLYLKAREIWRVENSGNRRAAMARAQPLLESAVQYDPGFALAWKELGNDHLGMFNTFDRSEERRTKAKEALDTAGRLDPDNVEIMGALATFYIDVGDPVRAVQQSNRLAQLYPDHAVTFGVLGHQAGLMGRPTEELVNFRKARTLDPLNPSVIASLLARLDRRRQYDEAEALLREIAPLVPPANVVEAYNRALIPFNARGDPRAVEAALAAVSPEARRTDPGAMRVQGFWAMMRGDADELIRLWEQGGPNAATAGGLSLRAAVAFAVKGRPEKARPILEKIREQQLADLTTRPNSRAGWSTLALVNAMLGDRPGALEARQKKLNATDRGGFQIPVDDEALYAWLGDKDLALAELARKLAAGEANVHVSRHNLFLWPLQGDPRFEALLDDPANHAPLF